jgi:hypothetical protein
VIRYDLACTDGHGFDGWFRSSADFDAQAARGLLSCPVCGSEKVEKALMTPAIGRSDRPAPAEAAAEAAPSEPPTASEPAAEPPPGLVALLTERDRELRAMLRAVREKLTANSENVGDKFAETARQMHNEEIEHRSIYGRATPEEAREMAEEGIEFHPLPTLPEDRS